MDDPENGLGLLQIDMASRFTGSKMTGSLSPNGEKALLALAAQSGEALQSLSPAELAARFNPEAPNRLTPANFVGWEWNKAGWEAARNHLEEAKSSTDPLLRQRA